MARGDDGGAARFLRRAITLIALVATLALVVGLSPALFALTVVFDLSTRARFATTRAVFMVLVYLAYELMGVLIATAIWLRGGDAERQLDANFRLQWWWAGGLFDWTRAIFELRVETRGVECARGGPVFVLSRHASVADTLLAAALLSRPYGLRLRYVLKRELLWDPCLDIVGRRVPNAFVQRGSRDTAGDVAAVRGLAENLGARDGVMIFPEGTRATPAMRARVLEKIEASPTATDEQREAARKLSHVLPPRLEGVLALLDADARADVIFMAHTGFESVRSLADLRRGSLVGAHVRVSLWRCPRAEIPEDRDGRVRWLNAQWQRVDDEVGAG